MDNKHMVNKIRKYIKVNGITQTRFAEDIGTTKFTLSRWMNGKSKPSPAYVQIIESFIK